MLRTMTIVLTIACAAISHAQQTGSAFSGTTTSSGMFGSRSLGQGISGGANNAFSGTPGNAVEQAQADAGQVSGDERFLRDSRAANAFVGADTADSTTFFSQSQGAALSGLEQFARAAAQRDFQGQNNNTNSRIQLRPRMVLGFSPPSDSTRDIRVRLSQRLAKLPQLEILDNVEVAIVGQTAVLRGRVATDYDRRMIAQIASLEPGVAAVQNDLLVGDSPPSTVAVSPFGDLDAPPPPKAQIVPAMNQPELAPPPAPRAPQVD